MGRDGSHGCSPRSIGLAIIGDILDEMRCGLQVPIRIRDTRVSEISAEGKHVRADSRWLIWTVLQRS